MAESACILLPRRKSNQRVEKPQNPVDRKHGRREKSLLR